MSTYLQQGSGLLFNFLRRGAFVNRTESGGSGALARGGTDEMQLTRFLFRRAWYSSLSAKS